MPSMSDLFGFHDFLKGLVGAQVFHELIIGVPCHMLRLWAFAGIMAQIPLIWITNFISKHMNNNRAGNCLFWLSFCVFGQPMCIILYYQARRSSTIPSTARPSLATQRPSLTRSWVLSSLSQDYASRFLDHSKGS